MNSLAQKLYYVQTDCQMLDWVSWMTWLLKRTAKEWKISIALSGMSTFSFCFCSFFLSLYLSFLISCLSSRISFSYLLSTISFLFSFLDSLLPFSSEYAVSHGTTISVIRYALTFPFILLLANLLI